MDKYLKINDFFGEQPKQRAINKKLIDCQGVSIASCIDETVAGFIVHAIASHDELVAEVERLREFERDAIRYHFLRDNCTIQQADSCGPIFVMTIRRKDNLFNIGLSIDEAMDERKTNG